MRPNAEGFLYPCIDEERCIHCGLCYTRCPSEHATYPLAAEPECYAAAASDELRRESSSGAIFPLLAEHVLEAGGYVCGAAWNEENLVEHIIISDKAELPGLKSSKYLQSRTGDVYQRIKQLLREGKPVLFSGTPCQVAGLNAILGKVYDNLLTVEVVCHGVPSPAVYKQYLETLVKSADEKVLSTNFRDKVNGWKPQPTITTHTSAATYTYPAKSDTFMRAFLGNLCLRKSCSCCPYARIPRQGDITLGDFWGIKRYSRRLNDKKGLSLVLINSPRGEQYMQAIRPQTKLYKKVPLKYAIRGNSTLARPFRPHADREGFFRRLNRLPLNDNLAYAMGDKYDCAILNFWFCSNYGAMLTCYALQEVLEGMGKTARVINYIPPKPLRKFKGSLSQRFAERYLRLTTLCKNKAELQKLNEQTDVFITGSDQIWRYPYYMRNGGNIFHLNFVQSHKKKIACAASFGTDHFEGPPQDTLVTRFYMQQFDRISVREVDGVNICRDTFGADATRVLDPVFLAEPRVWEHVISHSTRTEKHFTASYVLDKSETTTRIRKAVEKYFADTAMVDMGPGSNRNKGGNPSAEDWLYNVKHCDFFVTDSFHGTCFAIIFNKPFICIANHVKGDSRFQTLFHTFGLAERCPDPDKTDIARLIQQPIDWDRVNRIIAQEAEASKQWLREALEAPTRRREAIYDIVDTLLTSHEAARSRSLLPRFIQRLFTRRSRKKAKA